MNEIKRLMKENEIVSPDTYISLLNDVSENINKKNYLDILTFVVYLNEKPIEISTENENKFKSCIDNLISKLNDVLPRDLKPLLAKQTGLYVFHDNETLKNDIKTTNMALNSMISLISTTLIKYTTKEIENMIYFYFNPNSRKEIHYDFIKDILSQIYEIEDKQEKFRSMINFINVHSKKEIFRVLNYFIHNSIYDKIYFLTLYLINKTLYEEYLNIIFNESYYKRASFIEILPHFDLDLEKYDFNSEILHKIFQTRPLHRPKIVDYLTKNTRKKIWLLCFIEEMYDLFDESQFKKFGFSFDEHLKIASKNSKHLFYTFKNLKEIAPEHVEKALGPFANVLTTHENIIPSFCDEFEMTENLLFKDLFQIMCTSKKLPENVVKIFTDRFYSDENYFFELAQQLNKNQIFDQMENLLKNEESLLRFIALLQPVEIYCQIHYFKNMKNSIAASQLIKQRKDVFNEQVSCETIRKLSSGDLPPLFMRTVIVTLLNFPNCKTFVCELMIHLIQKQIWKDERLYSGFVKCLSILENEGINILMMLSEEQMLETIRRSGALLDNCEKYLNKNTFIPGNAGNIFKRVVRRELNRIRRARK
ncbi:hypothetical protein EDEG_01915 [Edhazardia aedis USNM 41457]|uniref:Symplekin C-terminal domain-containing protein n=1 Tax=Edhazardia aedis (strain USNM 41457) TaxID=1003232 RepID=J9D7L6_EDHAE|nr:hypothetical protein EDEG_01915 [Edhazardia aedis USNM 41457]|eukprot:EJW03786.1 hypothetical protein EDEG_01915 [Edhazardia aedis USNM 41457]